MLELLQVNAKRLVDLGNGAGEHHSPARRVFLDHREAVTARELLNRGDVLRGGTEVLREVFPPDMTTRPVSTFELLDALLEGLACPTPYEHGHFEPLGRIGFSDGPRSR
jgi:hypothetical protein